MSFNKKKQKSFSKSLHLIPHMSESKWREIKELEERDNFILQIREEIISKTLEICYEHYLMKQVIKFAVHCSHRAWQKIMDVNYLQHDINVLDTTWEEDADIAPCHPDSWMANTVRILDEIEFKSYIEDKISHISVMPDSEIDVFVPVESSKIENIQKHQKELALSSSKSTEASDDNSKLLIVKRVSVEPEVRQVMAESGPLYTLKQHRSQHSSFIPSIVSPSRLPAKRIEMTYEICSNIETAEASTASEKR